MEVQALVLMSKADTTVARREPKHNLPKFILLTHRTGSTQAFAQLLSGSRVFPNLSIDRDLPQTQVPESAKAPPTGGFLRAGVPGTLEPVF